MKRIRLTNLGEKVLCLVVMGILILGILFYQSYVRIPQIEGTIAENR